MSTTGTLGLAEIGAHQGALRHTAPTPLPGRRRLLHRPLASAVVVPPMVVYVGVLLATWLAATAYEALFASSAGTAGLLAIAALQLPLTYVLRTACRGLLGAKRGDRVTPFVGLGVLGVLAWVVPGSQPLVLLGVVAVLSILAAPIAVAWRRRWERFESVSAVLVTTDAWRAGEVMDRLEAVKGLRIESVLLVDGHPKLAAAVLSRPVVTQVDAVLSTEKCAIVSSPSRDPRLDAAVAQLVARGYDISSESAVLRAAEGRIDSELASPLNLLLGRPRGGVLEFMGRIQDLALGLPMLVVSLPFFAVIAALIKLDSKGPVFFRQQRVGRGGRPFDVLKFRTMRDRAEDETGPVWATEDDPRITRVGRFLRYFRLDELPQLMNVLRGEMALVGPRPERAHFFQQLRADLALFELRTAVRPGITGWAQIHAPYAAGVDDCRTKLDFDLFYVCRRSPWLDMAILFETVGVALSGKGSR